VLEFVEQFFMRDGIVRFGEVNEDSKCRLSFIFALDDIINDGCESCGSV
jgi:hypothetical protein